METTKKCGHRLTAKVHTKTGQAPHQKAVSWVESIRRHQSGGQYPPSHPHSLPTKPTRCMLSIPTPAHGTRSHQQPLSLSLSLQYFLHLSNSTTSRRDNPISIFRSIYHHFPHPCYLHPNPPLTAINIRHLTKNKLIVAGQCEVEQDWIEQRSSLDLLEL